MSDAHATDGARRLNRRVIGAQDAAAASQHLQAMPAPQVVAVQANPAGPSVVEQLTQLAQLRDSGVLTPAEFEVQKQRILAG